MEARRSFVNRAAVLIPFYGSEVHQCEGGFGGGERPLASQEKSLEHLAQGLLWCAQKSSAVEVDVQGFVSRQPFACNDSAVNERRNLELAEARRAHVVRELRRALDAHTSDYPEARVLIVKEGEPRWTGASATERLAQMRQHIGFRDAPSDDGLADEVFTRRVDVLLVQKGRCEL